jgi:hypothetical protein
VLQIIVMAMCWHGPKGGGCGAETRWITSMVCCPWMVLGEDSVQSVCANPIPAEQMTHHNDVPAGGQMVSGDTSLFLAQDTEL